MEEEKHTIHQEKVCIGYQKNGRAKGANGNTGITDH
jgi:hypothetical protein